MAAQLFANEVLMAARLLEREKVSAHVRVNFFRPAPMVVVAEWLEDDPAALRGKKWRRFDLASGKEFPVDLDNQQR